MSIRTVVPISRYCLAIIGILVVQQSALRGQDKNQEKPSRHESQEIEGWTFQIDARLKEKANQDIHDRTVRILANRLYDIKMVVPQDKIKRLQKVTIYLDLNHGKLKPAQYHPSSNWLKDNGYSETMAKCVHIPVAEEFSSTRHQSIQPWSILHELAHAYHDQVLGFDNMEVKEAYEKFKTREQYKNILHINGQLTRHYALTNRMEFFAEMTESYFGQNDFYPFNRAELKKEEPEVFELLAKIWGPHGGGNSKK